VFRDRLLYTAFVRPGAIIAKTGPNGWLFGLTADARYTGHGETVFGFARPWQLDDRRGGISAWKMRKCRLPRRQRFVTSGTIWAQRV
jgi:hypothetical protein